MCKTAFLKKTINVFQDQLSLNAGQNYCRKLQWDHSAILSTFIKLPHVIMIFILSIFERPFFADFAVHVTIFASTLNVFVLIYTCICYSLRSVFL